jgi:hypothetical protein
VTILDEATLQRQQSVDFTLDAIEALPEFKQTCEKVFGSGIYAAPLFILGKEPASALAFELKDESGRSLSLMASEENVAISAAVLEVICREKLRAAGFALSDKLAEKLEQLAKADAAGGEAWLKRLREPLENDPDREEIDVLLDGDDVEWGAEWWLETLATGSIVIVAFEPGPNHRRVLKLSYDEQIGRTKPLLLSRRILPRLFSRIASRLGWQSFRFWVISPFISSSRYHLDVKAPPDFRLTLAELTYSKKMRPVRATGFRRRAHLYIENAHNCRRGVAKFGLRVSGRGVLGGAFAAALLVFGAVVACMVFSKSIAEESGSMPALLLVLPGIIATYVARSDQHGLTTRLLAIPRWILLICAGIAAYYAAVMIALVGHVADGLNAADYQAAVEQHAESIRQWLVPALVASSFASLVIGIGWLCTREMTHSARRRLARMWVKSMRDRFDIQTTLRVAPETARAHVLAEHATGLLPDKKVVRASVKTTPDGEYIAHRDTGLVPWVHGIHVTPAPEGSTVTWVFKLTANRLMRPLAGLMVFREKRMAWKRIRALQAGQL